LDASFLNSINFLQEVFIIPVLRISNQNQGKESNQEQEEFVSSGIHLYNYIITKDYILKKSY